MFGLGRRVIDVAVLFLALYAFACVPLGKHTGLELCGAILRTRAAREAMHEVGDALSTLEQRILHSAITGSGGAPGRPTRDALPPGRGVPALPKLPRGRPPVNAIEAPAFDAPDASL